MTAEGPSPVAVMVFGINARRVGGIEMHTRELVGRLGDRGWHVVLCFHQEPSPEVRRYLSLAECYMGCFCLTRGITHGRRAGTCFVSSGVTGPACCICNLRRSSASMPRLRD